jgi:transcriptional regulator with XRE-family HTH domain
MGIGERVLKVAKDRGISQTQLSQELGLNPSTVSLWGREGRSPNIDDIPHIARILGVSLEYLFTGEDGAESLGANIANNIAPDKIPTEQSLAETVDSIPTKADLIGFIKSQQDILVTQSSTLANQSSALDKQAGAIDKQSGSFATLSSAIDKQSDTLATQSRVIEAMAVGGGRGSGGER